MTAVPGRLHFDADGKLQGAASITHNTPFPTKNGSYGSGAMDGVLMHTMVGNLQPGTVAVFNEDRGADSVSAHFGISQAGEIWQFGPVGKGWYAWHAVDANRTYYGIEHADNGTPDTPLTDAQLAASAQVVEALSAFAGFPLQEANAPGEKGYGTHSMGGAAYGGHSCPDLPPAHVRSQQRPVIIALAKSIRAGTPTVTPVAGISADGKATLAELAAAHHAAPSELLRATARQDGHYGPALAAWLDAELGSKTPPAGAQFKLPL